MAYVPTIKQNSSLRLKTVISLLVDCLRESGVYGHTHVIPCNITYISPRSLVGTAKSCIPHGFELFKV